MKITTNGPMMWVLYKSKVLFSADRALNAVDKVKMGLFHVKEDVSEKDTLTQNTHTPPSCIVIAPTYQPEHEWRSIQLIAEDSCLIVLIGIYKPYAASFKTFTPSAV